MGVAQASRDDVPRARYFRAGEKPERRVRILVVEDDASALLALVNLLRAEGFATSTAVDGESALAEARRARPDVVLTDLKMAPMGGVELCKCLHALDEDLPVIVMTAHSDMDAVMGSLQAGAEDYVIKPLQYEAVLWSVERAVTRRAEKREHEALYRTLNERLVLSSIREQEHAEAEAQGRAQLNTLLENLSEGVAIADPSGRVVMLNQVGRRILGVEGRDLQTVDALHALEACDLEGHLLDVEQRPLMRALRGEEFKDYEILRIRPNGERRRVVSTGASVRDENGNIALAIVVFRDLTELRRLEQQRDEYLALISHDLRNPLGVVLLAIDTLQRAMDTRNGAPIPQADLVDLAARAERNAKRMNVMLDELSESTSLEAGGVALECVACDLRELVANVVDSIDDTRARRVTIEAKKATRYVVLADASRIERVIANLLTNALKYSAADAPVTLRLSRTENAVELEVVDRGIGISADNVDRLFERYYRTPAGKARARGLGLGLYIARLIVEAHGGHLEVSSEVGKGSTFRLILPPSAGN